MSANIKLMHHQGLSPTLIASQLGISVKQVDSYIPGMTQAAAAGSASAATPYVHSQTAAAESPIVAAPSAHSQPAVATPVQTAGTE